MEDSLTDPVNLPIRKREDIPRPKFRLGTDPSGGRDGIGLIDNQTNEFHSGYDRLPMDNTDEEMVSKGWDLNARSTYLQLKEDQRQGKITEQNNDHVGTVHHPKLSYYKKRAKGLLGKNI